MEILRQLARRLLAPEAGISAQVQGEVFSDSALHQVRLALVLAALLGPLLPCRPCCCAPSAPAVSLPPLGS